MNNTKYRIARVAKADVWIPRDVPLLLHMLLLLGMEIVVLLTLTAYSSTTRPPRL